MLGCAADMDPSVYAMRMFKICVHFCELWFRIWFIAEASETESICGELRPTSWSKLWFSSIRHSIHENVNSEHKKATNEVDHLSFVFRWVFCTEQQRSYRYGLCGLDSNYLRLFAVWPKLPRKIMLKPESERRKNGAQTLAAILTESSLVAIRTKDEKLIFPLFSSIR